jgi:Txe/YoeB family toxin of toxin-antitoxin system
LNGNYKIVITKSAQKDKEKIKSFPSLKNNVDSLLEILRNDPFQSPPPFERLRGELSVYYSRRINKQHRLVYMIDTDLKVVKIVAMWTHYQRI